MSVPVLTREERLAEALIKIRLAAETAVVMDVAVRPAWFEAIAREALGDG